MATGVPTQVAAQLLPNMSGWLRLPLHLRLQLQLQMQLQLQLQLQTQLTMADPGGHRGPAPWRTQVATQLPPNMSGWLWLPLHLQLQLQLQMQLQLQLQLQHPSPPMGSPMKR